MSREKSCFGILFSLSIIIGIGLGVYIRKGMRMPEVDPNSVSASTGGSELLLAQDDSYEQTYLILGVDNLQGESQLQGAWLATLTDPKEHQECSIEVVLVTLYPLLPEQVITPEQSKFTKPHTPIQVDVHNINDLQTLEPLTFTENQWSDVIIMDEVVMNAAVQLSNVNFSGPINTPTAEMFVKSWENPEKAFRQQWGIITTLCTEPAAYGELSTIQRLIQLYGTHLLSTLDSSGLLKLWQVINYNQTETINCEIYPQLTH